MKQDMQTSSCSGEFCNLILALDPDRDLILHSHVGLERNHCTDPKKILLSKADRDAQAHDRAYRIVKKVLARSELRNLEESGNLLRLRISDRIDPYEMRYIPVESIMTSKREYRSTLLKISMAEEEEKVNSSFGMEDREHDVEQRSPSSSTSRLFDSQCLASQSPPGMVVVCSICYHAYNLLHRSRTLLSYEMKLAPIHSISDGNVERVRNKSPDMRSKTECGKQKSQPVHKIDKYAENDYNVPKTNSIPSTDLQTKSYTPNLNGITDLIDEFENAKRIILQQTSQFMMKSNSNRNIVEESESFQDPIKTKEKVNIIHDGITQNCARWAKNIKTPKPITSTSHPRDKSTLRRCESIKSNLSDGCLTLDHTFMTGILHVEDGISLPYRVLGNRHDVMSTKDVGQTQIYNMIVCNDIFDNYERFVTIFFPMVKRYPSLQVLLWNYPGQALTTFSDKKSMDNIFFADCLHKLLNHVGDSGTKQFDLNRKHYIMGVGCGGSVALLYTSKFHASSLRALLLINPLVFVDSHFSSVIHDCRNAFSCSPEARPDIPSYFFSRYLFSAEYLQRVSALEALNIYTADPNPITVKGRMKLCQSVLNFVHTGDQLKNIQRPIISIHGQNSYLVRPTHSIYLQEGRSNCTSIFQVLHGKSDGVVVYITKGGHELLQERRKPICMLIEQLLTTYHELFDARPPNQVFQLQTQIPKDIASVCKIIRKDRESGEKLKLFNGSIVYDPVTVGKPLLSGQNEASRWEAFKKEAELRDNFLHQPRDFLNDRPAECNSLSETKAQQQKVDLQLTNFDPEQPSFERNENRIYQPGNSLIYPNPGQYPRVKEMMAWRLRRNEKRLSRFNRAATVIQKSLRMLFAKTLLVKIRREASALLIQRCFRGMLGKKKYKNLQRELWAAKYVQRSYRGHLGRLKSYGRRMSIACQMRIARRWRGFKARRVVEKLVRKRFHSAIIVQCCWRKFQARRLLTMLTFCNKSCIKIQRVFRGYRDRRKASHEREKFIFSLSQSNGIELGRRLLAEHKLTATRLQSELSIIDREKSSIHVQLDELHADILAFEGEVSNLEREIHKITTFEREHPTTANGSGKYELKEKKIRLDQEFSIVLAKIADRKGQLQKLEANLSKLSSEREEKAGELKSLERKLVFLLEEQETALEEIRIRHKKNDPENSKVTQIKGDEKRVEYVHTSDKDKYQAAKLMESTETMMKFGFMSMSMTYFSSLNMIKAMKTVTGKSPSHSEAMEIGHLQDMSQLNDAFNMNILKPKRSKVDVDFWDVDQVIKWLQSIHLGQYEAAFRHGSVDGPFLCQLTDDDLRYVLEVEHKLHRKKILYFISLLVNSRNFSEERVDGDKAYDSSSGIIPIPKTQQLQQVPTRDNFEPTHKKPFPKIQDLLAWIKSRNIKLIQEALASIPDRHFDKCLLRVQFVEGVGTVYTEPYEREPFNMNKTDDHGNTTLHIAAQNGDVRIAKLLVEKGANPNHQNKQGQTPGHFAVAYQFFEFASWLFDERGGNANDLLANVYGLGPYDGLTKDL